MPTLNRYTDGDGYYIRQNIGGKFITQQLTASGLRAVRRSGLNNRPKRILQRATVIEWARRGYLVTGGGGPGTSIPDGSDFDTVASVRATIERSLPHVLARRRFTRILCHVIHWAHSSNPRSWTCRLGGSDPVLACWVGKWPVFWLGSGGLVGMRVRRSQLNRWITFPARRFRVMDGHHPGGAASLILITRNMTRWDSSLAYYRNDVQSAHRWETELCALSVDDAQGIDLHRDSVLRYLRGFWRAVPFPLHDT